MEPSDDAFRTLIDRAVAGDPDATRDLLAQYGWYIRTVVRRKLHPRLRSQYDSLDFVQDVWKSFLAARGQHRFDTPKELAVFLGNVARNKVTEVYRTRFETEASDIAREQLLVGGDPDVVKRQPSPSQWAIADERWEALLKRVPAAYRVILFRLRAGYTQGEVAEQTGVSRSTVNRVVRRLKEVTGL